MRALGGLVLIVLIAMVLFVVWGWFSIGFAHLAPVPGVVPGFLAGLFHGIIAPIALIWNWLGDPTVAIYARDNTTSWYDLGFILGLAWLMSARN